MNIKNINNIVFYKKVVNGMEMKAACIFGKDGSNDCMVRHGVELVGENILKILD